MDVIITAIGEFIWVSSCSIVNLCLSSGLSAVVVFVSFLCGILGSAFYKYTYNRERMLFDDNDYNQSTTPIFSTRSPSSYIDTTHTNVINSLSEIEIPCEQNPSEDEDEIVDDLMFDTTEEDIQAQQIKNIYHLLDRNDLTTADFVEQLKMYGVQIDDDVEL